VAHPHSSYARQDIVLVSSLFNSFRSATAFICAKVACHTIQLPEKDYRTFFLGMKVSDFLVTATYCLLAFFFFPHIEVLHVLSFLGEESSDPLFRLLGRNTLFFSGVVPSTSRWYGLPWFQCVSCTRADSLYLSTFDL